MPHTNLRLSQRMAAPPRKRRRLERMSGLEQALEHVGAHLLAGLDPFELSCAIRRLRGASPALRVCASTWRHLELGWRHAGGAPLSARIVAGAARFFERHAASAHVRIDGAMPSVEQLEALARGAKSLLVLECLGTLLRDEDIILRLAPHLAALRVLRLTHCTSEITAKSLRCLGAQCTQLQELRMSHVDVEDDVEQLRISACLSPQGPALLLDLRTEGCAPLALEFCLLLGPAHRAQGAQDDQESAPFVAGARLEVSRHLEEACGSAPHLLSLPKRKNVRSRELEPEAALSALGAVRRGRELALSALRRFPRGFRLLAVEESTEGLLRPDLAPRWELRDALEVRL